MNHQVLMRELHRRAHLAEELQTRLNAQAPGVAVSVDALALDVLHDQVGTPVFRAGVVQTRDVGMLESRQDAGFGLEALAHGRRPERTLHDLERHRAVEATVGAFAEVDGAHTAPTDLAEHPIRAQGARSRGLLLEHSTPVGAAALEQLPRLGVRVEHAHDDAAQLDVVAARLVERSRPLPLVEVADPFEYSRRP